MNWFSKSARRRHRLSRFLREHRIAILIAVGLAAFGATQSGYFKWFIPFQRLELASVDFRFHLRGYTEPSRDIVVVGLEESSMVPGNVGEEDRAGSEALQLMEKPYPWSRKVYALLLDRLFAAGAKLVAMDLLFFNEKEGDAELAAALKKYQDRVVIGSRFAPTVESEIYETPIEAILPPERQDIVGYTTFWYDSDAVIRRVTYRTSQLRQHDERRFADVPDDLIGFSALAVERFTGKPVPPLHNQLINFQGPAGMYRHLPIEEVFIDRFFKRTRQFEFGKIFQDKIVFVGPAAEIFHDFHNTTFGVMHGVEIHAQVAGSLLGGTLLRDAPDYSSPALTLALTALSIAGSLAVRHALWRSACFVALGAGFVLFSQWLFTGPRLVVPMVPPLFAFVCASSFGVLFDFLIEQRERARVRAVLDKYVSQNIAELVLADSRSFEESLRGQKKAVTVLFSDIRGFTEITETTDPDKLVAQLNEYFLEMVDSVLVEGGTLQRFIGDAILAVWGDTHTRGIEDDASRTMRAALLMRTMLARLNTRWKNDPARVQLKMGIGVNQGEVIVGNIGHPLRMEFTVLGDGVNTASRLESATKLYHCDILVGGKVEELTRGRFLFRRVDLVTLKGKAKPEEVFTPLADASESAPPWLDKYHRAVALYRRGAFREAAEIFRSVNNELGGDSLCEMYLARCENYERTPPHAGWDGSHTLTEK
jgi:adenylate cyclase